MSACLSAVQHISRLRGGSQSQLLRASDQQCYVTKFQNNPQHIRVLANEMLATRLGELLGLPMPRAAVIDVCPWLIEHTEALCIELPDRNLFAPDFSSLIAFSMASAPDRRIWS